ncbi:MAG: nicotinate (nicotinamide) nucleotide adenylyltransferase [Ginsengibacter sp.]
MKIGLYFGSFNPVHNGHLIIANHFVNFSDLSQIWFVISPQNPLKKSRALLNEQHRKHLIDLSIEGENKLRTSNVEFKMPKPSYTIDTLTYLRDLYPENNFAIIMGSDSFININRWKNYQLLLEKYFIYIYERPGFKMASANANNNKLAIAKAPLLDISSTRIRELIKDRKSIRYLVPDVVNAEIESHQYYQ